MKVNVEEYDGCFSIDFEPETISDTVMLVRMKLNGIKEVRNITAYAWKDGTITGSVVIGKRKQVRSNL